jgi:hypothetical protein
VRVLSVAVPTRAKQIRLIDGSPAEAARELVRALREDARVLGPGDAAGVAAHAREPGA